VAEMYDIDDNKLNTIIVTHRNRNRTIILTLSPDRQSARMSKITNDGLTGLAQDAL